MSQPEFPVRAEVEGTVDEIPVHEELDVQADSEQKPVEVDELQVPMRRKSQDVVNAAVSKSVICWTLGASICSPLLHPSTGPLLMSCCCPCILRAHMTSKIHRESAFLCCKDCYNIACIPEKYRFGCEGCKSCMVTACLASLLWPCSPALSAFSLWQRRKLKLFYPDDYRLKSTSSLSQGCYYCYCWPKNLLEQYEFVCQLNDEGMLTFAWDFDLYEDQKRPRPEIKSFLMMIFSEHSPAKMEFIRKFMCSIDRSSKFEHPATAATLTPNRSSRQSTPPPKGVPSESPLNKLHNVDDDAKMLFSLRNLASPYNHNTGQTNQSSSSNKTKSFKTNTEERNQQGGDLQKDADDQETKLISRTVLEGEDQIHSWVRNLSLTSSEVLSCVEIWDVPSCQFPSFFVKHQVNDTDIALYLFDPSMTTDSIQAIQQQYQENIRVFAKQQNDNLRKLLIDSDNESDGEDEKLLKKTISYLVVLTSAHSQLRHPDMDEYAYFMREKDLISWVQRQGSLWDHICVDDENDCRRFERQMMKLLKG